MQTWLVVWSGKLHRGERAFTKEERHDDGNRNLSLVERDVGMSRVVKCKSGGVCSWEVPVGPKDFGIELSVQFSGSVVSDSLQPHESQHTRPPCPSPTPRVHSDSRPSSPWCHTAISSSIDPFFSCPQSLPTSESFPMSQLFAWGGQSMGVSALASFLPKKSFRMDWLDLLAVQGTLKSLLQHHSSKASILLHLFIK